MKKAGYRKFFLTVTVILGITYWISNYYIQVGLVWGDSMLPTYHNMQMVVLNKYFKDYKIGDVVALRSADMIWVKRIVAGPGDRIQVREGKLYVNETPSVYYADTDITYAGIISDELLLETDTFFVMGDNHEESKDSRYADVGCIEEQEIIGKIVFP